MLSGAPPIPFSIVLSSVKPMLRFVLHVAALTGREILRHGQEESSLTEEWHLTGSRFGLVTTIVD